MKTLARRIKNFNFEYLFLLIWIVFLPIMSNKYFQSVSLFRKIQLSDLLFLLIFFVILIKTIKGKIKLDLTCLWFPLALLLVSFLISSFRSGNLRISLSETSILIYSIVIYLTVVNILRNREIIHFVLQEWIWVSSVIALLGIIGVILIYFNFDNPFVRFYPSFLDKKYRLISTFFLPNMAYSYFHIGFFLSLGMLINEESKVRKAIYSFITLALITAIFFTFSRGCAAFFVGLGFFLYFVKSNLKRLFKPLAYILFLISFIAFVFIQLFISYANDLNFSFKFGYDDFYKVDHSSAPHNRFFKDDSFLENGEPYNRLDITAIFFPGDYWYRTKVAIKLWQLHPVLGVGPGMFNTWITKLKQSGTIYIPKDFPEFDPHSTYFGTLAEEGLFGLFVLFILYFYFLRKSMICFKKAREPYFQNLILSCSAAFFGFLVFAIHVDIMNFRWLWFMLGLATAIINILEKEPKAVSKN